MIKHLSVLLGLFIVLFLISEYFHRKLEEDFWTLVNITEHYKNAYETCMQGTYNDNYR